MKRTVLIDGYGAIEYEDGEKTQGGWQPIETAPKDGKLVLLYCPGEDDSVQTGRWRGWSWEDTRGSGYEMESFSAGYLDPSRWMLLPEPPSE